MHGDSPFLRQSSRILRVGAWLWSIIKGVLWVLGSRLGWSRCDALGRHRRSVLGSFLPPSSFWLSWFLLLVGGDKIGILGAGGIVCIRGGGFVGGGINVGGWVTVHRININRSRDWRIQEGRGYLRGVRGWVLGVYCRFSQYILRLRCIA